jgi:hypothetical protein
LAEITTKTAHEIWLTAEKIKRVADKLVGIGPVGIGIEGFLAPVPLAGTLFSVAMGLWLIVVGFRARATPFTLLRMIAYVLLRTIISLGSVLPVLNIPDIIADIFFRGHLLAANALQKDIARRFGKPSKEAIAEVRRKPFGGRAQVPAVAQPAR